jgi:DNA-binding LytR/AlgR family response regulator
MSEVMMSALVVDDEAPARHDLGYLLRRSPRIGEVREAEDTPSAMDLLRAAPADVVFLDIQMPDLDGLQMAELLKALHPEPQVVFVTAFEQHAVEAFQLAAFDYLLKPVRADRLTLTLERLAAARSELARGPARPEEVAWAESRLAVVHRGQTLLLSVQDIRVGEVSGDRVALITAEGRYLARLRLQELEARLGRQGFLRVHRHYLVNLRHVTAVETFFNNTFLLRLDGVPGLAVPVSRRHGQQLRTALGL